MLQSAKTTQRGPVGLSAVPGSEIPGAAVPATPKTLADLITALDARRDLAPNIAAKDKSLLRNAARLAEAGRRRAAGDLSRPSRGEVPPEQIPCEVEWLNEHIFNVTPASCGMTKTLHRDSLTALRANLRVFDLIEPTSTRGLLRGTPWNALLEQANRAGTGYVLSRFFHWNHSQGRRPGDVPPSALENYEPFLRRRLLHADIPALIRMVSYAWNQMVRRSPDWPRTVLVAPARRDCYAPPISVYPSSVRDTVAAYLTSLGRENLKQPFSEDGRKKAVRASTLQSREMSIRQSFGALVRLGRSPDSFTGLENIVDPDSAKEILRFFWDRSMEKAAAKAADDRGALPATMGVTAQSGAIAATLLHIARHFCKLRDEPLKRLTRLVADMTPPRQSRISPKVLGRLRQVDDKKARADLLHLPQKMMEDAEIAEKKARSLAKNQPTEAARLLREGAHLAMLAAAIELLLHIPLRIATLTKLRLGVHIKRAAGSGQINHLVVPAEDTKNHLDLEWGIEPDTAAFLDRYLGRFLRIRAPEGTSCLFPSGEGRAGPLTATHLARCLNAVIEERVGIVWNPHLFRGLATRFVLERSPGALEDVRLLLGDKTLEIILAHYAAIEPAHAARRFHDLIRQLRAEAPPPVRKLVPPPRGKARGTRE